MRYTMAYAQSFVNERGNYRVLWELTSYRLKHLFLRNDVSPEYLNVPYQFVSIVTFLYFHTFSFQPDTYTAK